MRSRKDGMAEDEPTGGPKGGPQGGPLRAIVGLGLIVGLIVVVLFVMQQLRHASAIQDCVASGLFPPDELRPDFVGALVCSIRLKAAAWACRWLGFRRQGAAVTGSTSKAAKIAPTGAPLRSWHVRTVPLERT